MRTKEEHNKDPIGLITPFAKTWRALTRFATELTSQIVSMGRGGQRGFLKNVEILESWLRALLLQMSEQVELPTARRQRPAALTCAARAENDVTIRRPGFRAILPDEVERHLASVNHRSFDHLAASEFRRRRHDQRVRYTRRLDAISVVLENPERYARRVKQKLAARAKRLPIKIIKITHASALPDLLNVSPTSALGRYVWYNDSG